MDEKVMSDAPWFMYVLECKDLSLYCGITKDVLKRLEKHNAGRGAKYTQHRGPSRAVAAWKFPDCSTAASAEYDFKQMTRNQKLDTMSTREWRNGEWVKKLD